MTSRINSAERKAARFEGFEVRDLPGYRVVPDRFGMFELRVTGVVTFDYNSQTDRHDVPNHGEDYCWSVHNSPKSAVAKAHYHHKWIKKHMQEMGVSLPPSHGDTP
jgi:hypothetical protein